jgi:hypothetical protein
MTSGNDAGAAVAGGIAFRTGTERRAGGAGTSASGTDEAIGPAA